MTDRGPCFKCEDRHLACHDHCSKYKEWKDNYIKQGEARKKERKIYADYVGFKRETMDKVDRRLKKTKRRGQK